MTRPMCFISAVMLCCYCLFGVGHSVLVSESEPLSSTSIDRKVPGLARIAKRRAPSRDDPSDYYVNRGRTFNCYFVGPGKFKCQVLQSPMSPAAESRSSSRGTDDEAAAAAPPASQRRRSSSGLAVAERERMQADSAPQLDAQCSPKSSAYLSGCPTQACSRDADCRLRDGRSRCVCDGELCGSVCVSVDAVCKYLPSFAEGHKSRASPNRNENAVGQVLTLTCGAGFALVGPNRITCQANRMWSVPEERLPTCVPDAKKTAPGDDTTPCGRPKDIAHTIMEPVPDFRHSYPAGYRFTYSCSPGYRPQMSGFRVTAVCTNGRWSMYDIACSVINCGHPGTPANGRHLNRNYTYGQKVSYFCNEAYNLECTVPSSDINTGCRVRACQADGKWSGSVPVCNPILCPVLRPPKNGYLKSGRNTVNSVVEYFCNPGHRLDGNDKRLCRLDGSWDGADPTCGIQDCGPPPFVPNALTPVYSGTKFGAVVKYACKGDTKFEGESGGRVVCQNSGLWLPAPPRCRRHCDVPLILNARVLIGSAGGPEASGKVPSDTTLLVQCHSDYQLRTIYYPRCDNGSWTRLPECVPKNCNDRPPVVKNGIARFYSTGHNDRAEYTCYVGYEIVAGVDVLTCRYGKWIGDPPVCGKKRCPWIQSGPGVFKWLIGPEGQKNPWTRPETLSDNEELVKFECTEKGHVLKGHSHAICLNGQWRPPGSPECAQQMHKQIPYDWLFYRGGRK